MTASTIAIGAMLAIGVGAVLLCALGLLALRDPFDRLHALGPATIVGPILLATAVLIDGPDAQARIKAVLIALILLAVGPVLAHATARAALARGFGRTGSEDREGGP